MYKVNVNVWSNNQCAAAYDHRIPGEIKDSMICAAAPGKDSCSVRNKTGNYFEIIFSCLEWLSVFFALKMQLQF